MKLNPILSDIKDLVHGIKPEVPDNLLIILISYAMAEVTSNLRVKMELYDKTVKPLNFYGYIFGESGVGKDVSLNALNRIFIDKFSDKMQKGFDKHKLQYWEHRAMQLVDEDHEDVEGIIKEEQRLTAPFNYRLSSGTEAGVSKSRVTFGLYGIGAINLVIDELGSNYTKLRELMSLMLSTYEDGNSDGRLLKQESVVAVKGVPSNFLGYSSPALVFDGGITERSLFDDLSAGMARRSFFAYVEKVEPDVLTAVEIVERNRSKADGNEEKMETMAKYFKSLAVESNMNLHIGLTKDAEIRLAEYQLHCEGIVKTMPDINEQERLELVNRAWKATRLAGVYAFVSKRDMIDVDSVEEAIYVADISGDSFHKVMNRPPVYQRVFEYIKNRKRTSDVDLERQAWFTGNKLFKKELLSLARVHGFENNFLFRIKEVEGVDFYSFVEVPKTDINNITISISEHIAKGFKRKKVPFEILHEVVCNPKFNYSAGTFKRGHRNKSNYEKMQNLIIIDIDDGMKLETAKIMFSNYKCLIATTRNHQKEKHGITCDRFRIIFITDRTIKLDSESYSNFMTNVYESLGIPADESCKDSSRAYYGAKGEHWYSEGTKLFEISNLIPSTTKETEHKVMLRKSSIGNTEGIERFLLEEAVRGARSNSILKYGMFLVSSGYEYQDVEEKVLLFNERLPEPLTIKEVRSTILKSIKRKYDE